MTTYNVHIYREMKLKFDGIEADAPEAAAAIARDKPTDEADSIDDCDGETLGALVDEVGDEQYERSEMIDFELERQRKAAPRLRPALESALEFLRANDDGEEDVGSRIAVATAALAEADAAGISSDPAVAARAMYDALACVAEILSGFKPDFLANIGLGVALEKTLAALHAAEAMHFATLANPGVAEPPPADGSAKKPYSVLLLYPEDVNDSGTETLYGTFEVKHNSPRSGGQD